jgi:hypothetical protein
VGADETAADDVEAVDETDAEAEAPATDADAPEGDDGEEKDD